MAPTTHVTVIEVPALVRGIDRAARVSSGMGRYGGFSHRPRCRIFCEIFGLLKATDDPRRHSDERRDRAKPQGT
jgi:hypothetical protein